MLVKLTNVTKIIKGNTVLDNITWSIDRGYVYGITGANGSGKTMLLRAISGFLYISTGKIQEQTNLRKGIIIENPEFLEELNGLENLQYLARINNAIDNDRIYETMLNVGLEPNDLRKVKVYSLGMKQRLAIAQAIMEQPDLLILDEPTRGLDQDGINQIYKVLNDEKSRGATILIASHNIKDIQKLRDEIVFMENAKLYNYIKEK